MTTIDPYKHVLKSAQFSKEFLFDVFDATDKMQDKHYDASRCLKNKIVSLVFYETSTRTRMSFETAALKLGAGKIHTENAAEFSSVSKGESLEDTVRIVSQYSDFLVLRHPEDNSSEIAASYSKIPVINAGSGQLHHPTQALLDVYTIYKEKLRITDLKITVIGDLLKGRTCDSLVYLLSKFNGNRFYFVSPPECRAKSALTDHLKKNNVPFDEIDDLKYALSNSDIIYMTRIQKERYRNASVYEKTQGKFILNSDTMSVVPDDAIIMHPLPRVDEIHPDVDKDPRAKYFKQAANGLFVRMALLKILNDHRNR